MRRGKRLARELIKLGHEVRLIASQFVKPYVKGNQHDEDGAEAICEAVGQQGMRFVPLKCPEKQDIQMLNRIRQNLGLADPEFFGLSYT